MPFHAEARVASADPRRLMDRVAAHLTEHGALVADSADRRVIRFPFGAVGLAVEGGALRLSAEAGELDGLLMARASLASHVLEFAEGERLDIVWAGDGSGVLTPPNYRELTVTATAAVTPRMRRVHFAARDLARFADIGNIHVKLAFPGVGQPMPAPIMGRDGLPGWPDGLPQPVLRKYTIRAIDVESGSLAVDFVLHDHPGPGSAWALRARPGDRIGMSGPGGLGLAPADWRLFVTDETGLPAVARMLEALPTTAAGEAIIEVADAAERQPLRRPPGFAVTWLHRSDGAVSLLEAAKAVVPPKGVSVHVWAAAEFGTFRALRAHVRDTLALAPGQHLVVAYWRRGQALADAPEGR